MLTVANGYYCNYDGGAGIYGANGSTVIVNNSTFSGNSAHRDGGGIYSAGTLIVSDSNFLGNSAGFYYDGGGIFNNHGGTLDIRNSTFTDNTAGDGAGIANYGTADVSDSIFSGNDATGYGGAIYSEGSSFSLTVSNSTFSDNTAGTGGGIDNRGVAQVSTSTFCGNSASYGGGICNRGVAQVSTSTFCGNSASRGGGGGGIWNFRELTVSNSTFSDNGADWGGGIGNRGDAVIVSNSTFSDNEAIRNGGGIYTDSGSVTLKNSIVANSPTGGNCVGTITDGSGNLSYPDATCPGINGNPLLGPLQNNLGPTETMALGPGSAAIDAGIDAICAAAPVNGLDQRGIARPWGPHCDIGAYEHQVFALWWWFPFAPVR